MCFNFFRVILNPTPQTRAPRALPHHAHRQQASRKRPLRLTRATTDEVHMEGGTMLGTSRTKPNLREIIKW